MSLKRLADELGITPQAIYKRLKTEGIPISDLKSGANLTQEGEEIIRNLFETQSNMVDSQLLNELSTVKAERDMLVEQLKLKEIELEFKEKQLVEMRTDREAWRKAADQAQQLQLAQLKALPDPSQPRKSWFKKILGK